MKRALSWIGNIIFVAVVLCLCYYVIMASRNQAPSVFGYRILRVLSDSMGPVFTSGECIIVKETPKEEIQVGDIITFVSSDPYLERNYNTHRVFDIVKDENTGETVYFTKGDRNSQIDDYAVYYEDIVGKYVYKLPYSRVYSAFLEKLSDGNYYFAFVIVPILICFISSVLQLVKEVRRKR